MSQEQIVIAGVIALNLVLLILLFTAYRLITARTQPEYAQVPQAQALHTAHTQAALPTEAEEIQGLEALFAHDSWPDDRFGRGGQFTEPAVREVKE